MALSQVRTRQVIFVVGIALLIFGFVGLLLNAPWGNVANSIFTFFGTTMSFAQFSIGFTGLKPAESTAKPAQPDKALREKVSAQQAPAQQATPPAPAKWQPKAKLISSSGQMMLGSAQFTIGRAPDNQKVLSDPQVSGYHALVRPEGQGFVIMDLGSSNGTWVNGQRLTAKVPRFLNPGDSIRVGNVTFTYEAEGQARGFAPGAPAPTLAAPSQADAYTPPPIPVVPSAAAPIAPPPPGFAPASYGSMAAMGAHKTYYRSGIAFVLTGILTIFYILVSFIPLPPDSYTFFTAAVFALIWIAAFGGLRGFYAKQADSGGWYVLVGTIMLAAGWLLNILAAFFTCVFLLNHAPSLYVLTTNGIFYKVNYVFLIGGDIILGIGVVRARVYPRWTGIALAIVGFLQIFGFLSFFDSSFSLLVVSLLALMQLIAAGLAAAIFFRLGAALMK